jgi:hypothetical protein
MTTKDLARESLPYVKQALKSARPAIVEQIGRAGMLVVWPAWSVLTGPLLPLLVRIAIELAVGLTAPNLLPVLEVLERLATTLPEGYIPPAHRTWFTELVQLLGTPRSQMHEAVQDALTHTPGAPGA